MRNKKELTEEPKRDCDTCPYYDEEDCSFFCQLDTAEEMMRQADFSD